MPNELDHLKTLEQRLLWLSAWMVHNANHLRPKGEGDVKVGGHQASCASMVSIMTALYFHTLRPEERVAVKPHASPVFHAMQYIMGNQTLDKLKSFRGYGGAQSYPSRTKDVDDVDFSTGSVGLGVAETAFASIVQDYLAAKDWADERPLGRILHGRQRDAAAGAAGKKGRGECGQGGPPARRRRHRRALGGYAHRASQQSRPQSGH